MNDSFLSGLLDDPEAMKKITELAGQLAGNPSSPASDSESQAAAAPSPPAVSSAPDPASELMQKAVPLLTNIAYSGQNAADPDRLRLLTALKPFLSASSASQLEHAARLLSMAHMTLTAASQLLSQDVKEV